MMMSMHHHHLLMNQCTFFRTLTSLTEYIMDFVVIRQEEICSSIIVYHAGVAGKLGGLNLKRRLCCLMKDFFTIIFLAECNWMPWVVFTGSNLKTSPTKVMHHAGVAAMKTFYMEKYLLNNLYILTMSKAECKLINFKSIEELSIEMRSSLRQVVHHAGVAAMMGIMMFKQRYSVKQKNREVDENRVQISNFSFVVGVLQLLSSIYSV